MTAYQPLPRNPWDRAKADAMACMMADGEVFERDDPIRMTIYGTVKPPTTRETVYPTDATRGTGHAPSIGSTPTPLKPGDKFATVFTRSLSQSSPARVVGRYPTLKKAIADAVVINSMKDTQTIVIEYDGESDSVDREYSEHHTVWREK